MRYAALIVVLAGCVPPRPEPTPAAGPHVALSGRTIPVRWIFSEPERRHPLSEPPTRGRGVLVGYAYDRIQHYHSAGVSEDLEVAFLSREGDVVELRTLPAGSEEGVTSAREARYALFLVREADSPAAPSGRAEFSREILEQAPMPPVQIRLAPGAVANVELSHRASERYRGLMYRRALSPDDGMLFIYPAPGSRSFFMLHCTLSLDIAFFDAAGRLLNVVPMDPYPDPAEDTGARAVSEGDAQYVLEVRKGWFRAKGLVDAEGRPSRPVVLGMPELVRRLAEVAE